VEIKTGDCDTGIYSHESMKRGQFTSLAKSQAAGACHVWRECCFRSVCTGRPLGDVCNVKLTEVNVPGRSSILVSLTSRYSS